MIEPRGGSSAGDGPDGVAVWLATLVNVGLLVFLFDVGLEVTVV